MRRVLTFLVASLLIASESAAAPPPLDRILAVVDQGVITLSEVRTRARPHVQKLEKMSAKPPEKAALDALHAEVLEQIINERLIASDAETRHISVAADEIDRGIAEVAQSNKLTTEQLFAEVERARMTRAEYREEIRRQLLDGRWTLLAVGATVKVSRSDEKAFRKALEEGRAKELQRLRATHYIEVRK